MSRPRLFIGFPVTKTVKQKVETLPAAFGSVGEHVSWSTMEELLLTVLFLGEVPTTDWMTVCRSVQSATAEVMPFEVSFTGLGAFPNLRRPRVVYAGVTEGAEGVIALHNAIADRLAGLGYQVREERGYSPHLTIGRVGSDDNHEAVAQELQKWSAWDAGRMMVTDLTIFSSEQRKGRYEYTVVGRYPLDG
jgi:RNA 2',3'-cyclic 3'-phosphodiesterase